MRLDRISVELRPRSSWEAAELGTALVRAHAGTIWRAWWCVALPAFVLCNAVGWWFDALWVAMLAMWWLKPVFDRVPVFVLSRAVFGAVPTLRETLAAQRTWGWRPMLHYLTWRRLGPYRSLYLPVDLLEGGGGKHARRNVIGGSARGVAGCLTLVFANFEGALALGVVGLVPLFVPLELVLDMATSVSQLLFVEKPRWAELLWNGVAFGAMTVIEPFYVGAGFGLYLNRRTQLEAWDVELAFRRMRERLATTLAVACIALGVAAAPVRPAFAATAAPASSATTTLPAVFGEDHVPTERFERAVDGLDDNRALHPRETRTVWAPREKPKPKRPDENALVQAIGNVISFIVEFGLWIAIGLVALALLATAPRWLPWLRNAMPIPDEIPSVIDVAPTADPDAMPDDIAGTARRLWSEGKGRRALALLYRASVAGMVARTGALLVPGATEAECLRAARALRASEDREAFASAVRTWQYAAYADRMPDDAAFDALLARLSDRFGWAT